MAIMNKIFYKGKLIGIKITRMDKKTRPVTHAKEYLQLLTIKHPKGTRLDSHYHSSGNLKIKYVQECLFLRKGKVRLDIHGPRPVFKFIKYIYLNPGDAFIVLNGGYGIKMIKDSELFEAKSGPFYDDKVVI